jgi:hypothetical protein
LRFERAQEACFGRRKTVGVTDAELPQLLRVTRKNAVIHRQSKAGDTASFHSLRNAIDGLHKLWVIRLSSDAQRARHIAGANNNQIDALG